MEPTSGGSPQQPQPTSAPVMDIKAPARASGPEPVKAAPPEAGDALMPESVELKKDTKKKAPKPPKVPKTHSPGVGLAIFATMVIVLGLGALFVYAYLQTNHLQLF